MKVLCIAAVGTLLLTVSSSALCQEKVQAQAPPPATPASTTTVTSADDDVAPPATRPPEPETITLYNGVRPNKPLLFTGGVMLLGAYSTTAALTAVSNNPNADKNLYLPIVGPWVHLGSPSATAGNTTADTVLVAGSGVIQGVGAGLMILSLFVPESVPAATIQAGNTRVQIAPASFGASSAGVGAAGMF
jgi:hypothetical protein